MPKEAEILSETWVMIPDMHALTSLNLWSLPTKLSKLATCCNFINAPHFATNLSARRPKNSCRFSFVTAGSSVVGSVASGLNINCTILAEICPLSTRRRLCSACRMCLGYTLYELAGEVAA